MKKVGIMTWIRYQNYGTALQAGALSNIIKMMGYKSLDINYCPRAINDSSHFNSTLQLLRYLGSFRS